MLQKPLAIIHFEGVVGFINPDHKAGIYKLINKKMPEKGFMPRFMIARSFKNFFKILSKSYTCVLLLPAKVKCWIDFAQDLWQFEAENLSSIYVIRDSEGQAKRKTL